jgi:hypothetical protein
MNAILGSPDYDGRGFRTCSPLILAMLGQEYFLRIALNSVGRLEPVYDASNCSFFYTPRPGRPFEDRLPCIRAALENTENAGRLRIGDCNLLSGFLYRVRNQRVSWPEEHILLVLSLLLQHPRFRMAREAYQLFIETVIELDLSHVLNMLLLSPPGGRRYPPHFLSINTMLFTGHSLMSYSIVCRSVSCFNLLIGREGFDPNAPSRALYKHTHADTVLMGMANREYPLTDVDLHLVSDHGIYLNSYNIFLVLLFIG